MGDSKIIIVPRKNRQQVPLLRLPRRISAATRRRSMRRRFSARSGRNFLPNTFSYGVNDNTKFYKEKDYGPYTSQTKIQSSESKHTQAGKTKKNKAKRKNKKKSKKRTKGRKKRRKNSYKRKRKK